MILLALLSKQFLEVDNPMAYRRSYSKPKARTYTGRRRKAYAVKRTRSARGQTVRIELVTQPMGGVARPMAVVRPTTRRRVF